MKFEHIYNPNTQLPLILDSERGIPSKPSGDRPRLVARWTMVDGRLTCRWVSPD